MIGLVTDGFYGAGAVDDGSEQSIGGQLGGVPQAPRISPLAPSNSAHELKPVIVSTEVEEES